MPRRDGPAPRVRRLPRNPSEYKIRFTSAARRARALRKLGVSADQLAGAPPITPFLRDIRGGPKAVLEAIRFSQNPVVRCFLAKRASLGVWARQNICWEAISLAAGLDPAHLLGAALLAWREHTIEGRGALRRVSLSGSSEKAI